MIAKVKWHRGELFPRVVFIVTNLPRPAKAVVRLQLFALAYNPGNFFRQMALPKSLRRWTLTTLREKVIHIGAKVISHARHLVFQMAEVAVPRELFQEILRLIDGLRPRPAPA